MRILLITETVPYPLDTGGRMKTWHTIAALAREHEIHCHAFIRSERQRQETAGPLSAICASVRLHFMPRRWSLEATYFARSVWQRVPFTILRHYSVAVMAHVAADARRLNVDAVYCDHLSMLEYGRRLTIPVIHDAHNIEHQIVDRYADNLSWNDPRRPLFRRESRLLRQYEMAMYRKCALIFAVSDVDAAQIAAGTPGAHVVPVPIAVPARTWPAVKEVADAPELMFVGAQDWPPNADAIEYFLAHIWPIVLRERPDARLTVIGRGERAMRRHRAAPSVRFTGWVADLQPLFTQSRLMVVPLRSGGGMRVKILEAFGRGVPVVSTTVGIEGIEASDGEHALIADTPMAFAAAVLRLLRDKLLAERLATAARALVLNGYNTESVARLQLQALRGFQSRSARSAAREAAS